ncbi:MAG: cyclopropane-fatty-acyl-phospholipid synthase family protein [Verrucomicrobia bacterium]|nr:cyclopropane-fatty-acyl-phospholipid synthase family protein [Verrucomicrobiota bacterium]
MSITRLAERGLLPDALIRLGIRRLLEKRLQQEAERPDSWLPDFIRQLDSSPVAVETDKANEQHYEVPAPYFELCLGPRLKYSGALWESGVDDLATAEEAMLALTAERAAIKDGDRILELGCGWGSFTLWAAEHFPNSKVVGVSNSHGQRKSILEKARLRGLSNVTIITADMNEFQPEETFDRIVSIEMFEHMKNYRKLLERIAGWLSDGGTLFVHIFTHRRYAYPFEDSGEDHDWMARYFFTGGNMPSDDLLLHFPEHLFVEGHWHVNGVHYSKTLEAWLQKQDQAQDAVLQLFTETYGSAKEAKIWCQRWRMFYMACSELFKFDQGRQWMVSHYRFRKR